jgi:glutamyl-tRNA synthetase
MTTTPKKIITRFAPSPTGTLHTGGARTALFAYLYAKQRGGKFILRIDDTDKVRSTKEFEKAILDGMNWLGLSHDEIFYQSERTEIYQKYLKKLLSEDKIYISKETIEKEGDRAEVIRFRNPNKKVSFHDLIRGKIEFDTTELGDFVIAKDMETPLYHFASVVDDFEMGISHVIRGEDHISNTPRQILMWEAIGADIPKFAHLPMIMTPDRTKLSKRKHASIASLNSFIDMGYLSEAVVNFVALLGWSPQSIHNTETNSNDEILSLDQLLKIFDLEKVQKSGAVFNIEKLNWLNREYIRKLSAEEFISRANPFTSEIKALPDYSDDKFKKIIPLLLERIYTLAEIKKMFEEGEIQYFFSQPQYVKELLKNTSFLPETIKIIEAIPEEQFTTEGIKVAIWDFATEKGRGDVLWPMRIALSGKEKSPDPFTLASTLGKTETLSRLTSALNL